LGLQSAQKGGEDVFNACIVFFGQFGFLTRTAELPFVPVKRVLLHVVDVHHFSQTEEED